MSNLDTSRSSKPTRAANPTVSISWWRLCRTVSERPGSNPHVPQDGLSATGPLPPGHNQDMSKGAEMTDLPGPTFPLKAPGTAVVHAGARQKPRIVSVPARCIEHTVELPGGADLFDALEKSLSEFAIAGIMAEFLSGEFRHIDYVHPAYGPDVEHPM